MKSGYALAKLKEAAAVAEALALAYESNRLWPGDFEKQAGAAQEALREALAAKKRDDPGS